MKRNIMEATNVRTPDSLGRVITMAKDASIIPQINHDMCEFNSENYEKKKLFKKYEKYLFWVVLFGKTNITPKPITFWVKIII